ncbi:hypothetical protein CHCC20335_4035 [Bacillus paralicheniformis]|nr:hypothetical protein CHCC20335_4035 [Bacillus paralicheniformis]GIN66515.1 hypothetical protein J41TS2_19360 [Bacillus sonorensis]
MKRLWQDEINLAPYMKKEYAEDFLHIHSSLTGEELNICSIQPFSFFVLS